MAITHGAVRRASGAGPGWDSFQTTGCLGHTGREMKGGKKIREEKGGEKIKDNRERKDEMPMKGYSEIKVGRGREGGRC